MIQNSTKALVIVAWIWVKYLNSIYIFQCLTSQSNECYCTFVYIGFANSNRIESNWFCFTAVDSRMICFKSMLFFFFLLIQLCFCTSARFLWHYTCHLVQFFFNLHHYCFKACEKFPPSFGGNNQELFSVELCCDLSLELVLTVAWAFFSAHMPTNQLYCLAFTNLLHNKNTEWNGILSIIVETGIVVHSKWCINIMAIEWQFSKNINVKENI